MKRSEMIELMTNKYGELSRGGWSEASEEERMSEILDLLVYDLGMKPPEYDMNAGSSTRRSYCVYEWEPEDEKE